MNRSQKIAIALIFFSFIGVYRQSFLQTFKSRATIIPREKGQQLFLEAQAIGKLAEKKIADGTYTVLECQRHLYRLSRIDDSLGVCQITTFSLAHSVANSIYNVYAKPKLNPQPSTSENELRAFKFRSEWDRVQQQVLTENNVRKVDWSGGFRLLKSLYLKFLLFAFLILLVKRWPVRRFNFRSFGDFVSLLVATFFWPIGIFVYQPKSYFQQKLDSQVRHWKTRVGDRGWRLALAYLTAFFVTVLSLIKVDAAKAVQSKIPKIVCVANVPEIKLPVTEVAALSKTPEPDLGQKDDLLEKIITAIKKVLFGNFVILEIKTFPLAPVRKLLWLVIRPIRAVPRRICQKINSVRAPAAVVLVHFTQPRTTKQGVENENENHHCFDFFGRFLFWRDQIFWLRPSAV
ncbi:MAG: hypothetical protein PHT40_03980 [Patescibacteria group bacterium]|nr:hypothetical protein [Patescibacteria group bacterium]